MYFAFGIGLLKSLVPDRLDFGCPAPLDDAISEETSSSSCFRLHHVPAFASATDRIPGQVVSSENHSTLTDLDRSGYVRRAMNRLPSKSILLQLS